jgi:ABC-type multidrug transport system ATPase subunit
VVPTAATLSAVAVHQEEATEPAVLVCDRLTVTYRGCDEPAVQDLSFHLPGNGFLAVVGPSGSGKSTLCGALLGEIRDTSGHLVLGGADLLGDQRTARRLVSFVPQHDALHAELTPRQILRYVAELRLRQLYPEDQITRVDQVLELLDLLPQADQRVGFLSGGQRKRVAVAMELMSSPRLLVLDEPTAGLDEGLDLVMMNLLRKVADAGTGIIVVTHSTANLQVADAVLALGKDGRMAYCGPPGGMLSAFRSGTHAEAMQALRSGARPVNSGTSGPGGERADQSPLHPEVEASLDEPELGLRRATSILFRREVRRMLSSPLTLARGVLLLPLLTVVLTAWAADRGLAGTLEDPNRMQGAALSVLITCTTFFAMALSFSSIVGDRAVIEREFRWGVPATGVVLSKGLSLIIPVLIQITVTVTGYLLWRPGPDTPLEGVPSWLVIGTGLAALGLSAMALGLLVSAAAPRLDRAVFGLMGAIALLVVLTGLLIPLGNPSSVGGDVLSALSQVTPTRWGTAVITAEIGYVPNEVLDVGGTVSDDPLWGHDFQHVGVALAALASLGVSYLLVASELLVAQSRRRR